MVFEKKPHMPWAYEAYEAHEAYEPNFRENVMNGFCRLLTPSTVCLLLPPLRRSPSLEEGGLGAPVKAYGLAVDWI